MPSPKPSSIAFEGIDPAGLIGLAMGDPEAQGRDAPSVEELGPLLPDYDVREICGRGGMGVVYRAVQRKLGREVAIKIVPVEMGDAAGFAERFRREAMATAGLVHPCIVAVHDAGETLAGHHYYAMEFVDGEDLARRMARGRLPLEECVRILEAVCSAVEAAHVAGVIHRDIKPSNILLTKEGRPKLADFGLALLTEKHLEYSRLTLGGTTLGTLEYAAPEQLRAGKVSPASDIYSLGVLTYELLTGELPRGVFDPPSARNAEVDPAFDGVVLRALQSDPERRYETVADFRAAILKAADHRLQQEQRERELRRKGARRARAAVFFLGIALLTAGSAVFAWLAKREANERRITAENAQEETESIIQFLLTDLRKRLEATGNLGAMESVLERAVTHFRKKHEESGRAPEAAVQLADALTVKGDVFAARDMEAEAIAHFMEALTLMESARNAEPRNAQRGLRLVRALGRCSRQREEMGRYEEALADAHRMLREAQAITDPAARREEAAAHKLAAFALSWLERLDECRAEYLLAQKILAELAAAHPEDAGIAFDLAALDMSLGNLAQKQWNFPLMLTHYQAWYDWAKKTQGTEGQYYAHTATRLSYAFVFNHRPADALAILGDARRIATRECEAKPGNKDALNLLYYTLRITAEAQLMIGQEAESKATFAEVAKVQAAQAAPPKPEPVLPPAEELAKWEGREAEAFKAAVAAPDGKTTQAAWAAASERLGEAVEAAQGRAAAVEHCKRQLEKVEPLRKAAPADSWWNFSAGSILYRLADLLSRDGSLEMAESFSRQALEARRRLAIAYPTSHSLRSDACVSADQACGFLLAQNRASDAVSLLIPLLKDLEPMEQDTFTEWRAALADTARKVLAALPAAEAPHLAAAVRAFLTAPGENHMTTTELANLAALERAEAKFKQ